MIDRRHRLRLLVQELEAAQQRARSAAVCVMGALVVCALAAGWTQSKQGDSRHGASQEQQRPQIKSDHL